MKIKFILTLFALFTLSSLAISQQDWVTEYDKLSDTTTGFSGVLDAGDAFGKSIVTTDIDLDGFDDLLVTYDYNSSDRGSLLYISLDSSLGVGGVFDIIDSSSVFTSLLANDSVFGNNLKVLPDLNRDGKVEFYASSIIKTNQGLDENSVSVTNKNQGKGYIFQLTESGDFEWIKELAIVSYSEGASSYEEPLIFDRMRWGKEISYTSAITGFDSLATTSREGLLFGSSITSPGDLDGNGYKDLVVTAPMISAIGTDTYEGGLKVLFLGEDFEVLNSTTIDYYNGGLSNLPDTNDYMGIDIVAVEDINSDGRNEVMISGKNVDGASVHGKVWVMFFDADGTLNKDLVFTHDSLSLPADQYLGHRLALVHDVDNDGVRDVCVVSSHASSAYDKDGRLDFFSVGKDGVYIDSISSSYNGMEALFDDAYFGLGICYAGNLNGNGSPYLIAGSKEDADGGSAKGALYFLKLDDTISSGLTVGLTSSNVVSGVLGSFDLTISGGNGSYIMVNKEDNRYVSKYQFDALIDTLASQMSGMGIGTMLNQFDYEDYLTSIDIIDSWDTLLPGVYSFVVYDSLGAFASVNVELSEDLVFDLALNVQNQNDTISKVQTSSDWVVVNSDNGSTYGEDGAFSYTVLNDDTEAFLGASRNTGNVVPDAVLHYDMEGGSLKEHFGNGGDLVIVNEPIGDYNSCGDSIGAYYFDGVNDYMKIPDDEYLDFGSDDFTITTWAKKVSDLLWGNTVINNWYNGGTKKGENEWALTISSGNYGQSPPGFTIESGLTAYSVVSSQDVALNTWAFLAATRKNDSIFIYVDGVKTGSLYVGNVSINDMNRDALIGRIYTSRSTNVIVDDFGVYDLALTDDDIAMLYADHVCEYSSSESAQYASVDFGIYQDSTSVSAIYHGEAIELSNSAEEGDEYVVKKTGGTVNYYKNGVLILQKTLKDSRVKGDGLLVAKSGVLNGSFQVNNLFFSLAPTSAAAITNSTCADVDNGEIDLTINSWTSHTVSWSGPNSFTSSNEDITGLEPGAYTVTLTNSFGSRTKRFWVGYPTFWENRTNLDYVQPISNNVIEATTAIGSADSKNEMAAGDGEFIRWVGKYDGTSATELALEDVGGTYNASIWTFNVPHIFNFSFVEENGSFVHLFSPGNTGNRRAFHIEKNTSNGLTYVQEAFNTTGPGSQDVSYTGGTFAYALESTVEMMPAGEVQVEDHLQSACFDFLAFGGYIELNKAINEEYTPLNDEDNIKFVYYEDYVTDGNAFLSFSLVDEAVGTELSGSFSSQALIKGWNKFDLDISSMGLAASTYLLKVFNPKGDTYYLRFKID